jgi:hypothetical protein
VAFLFTGLGTCLAVAAVFLDRRRADVPAAVTGQHAAPQDPIK